MDETQAPTETQKKNGTNSRKDGYGRLPPSCNHLHRCLKSGAFLHLQVFSVNRQSFHGRPSLSPMPLLCCFFFLSGPSPGCCPYLFLYRLCTTPGMVQKRLQWLLLDPSSQIDRLQPFPQLLFPEISETPEPLPIVYQGKHGCNWSCHRQRKLFGMV